MAKSANLYVRIEPDVKGQEGEILVSKGILVCNGINNAYSGVSIQ